MLLLEVFDDLELCEISLVILCVDLCLVVDYCYCLCELLVILIIVIFGE